MPGVLGPEPGARWTLAAEVERPAGAFAARASPPDNLIDYPFYTGISLLLASGDGGTAEAR
jgi:hypothetical protein